MEQVSLFAMVCGLHGGVITQKSMIEYDRKYCFQTEGKNRDDYVALPLDSKDRKKIIKRVEELEKEHWLAISRTPHEELLKWHDEKLKTEVRMLEAVH